MAKAQLEKKKYTPQILNTFKYRGFKIREIFNRKTKRREFGTRFQINNKEFRLTNDTRSQLQELIDEIYHQERRAKHNLEIPKSSPSLKELFDKRLPMILRPHQKKMATRIFRTFLALLPENIKITDLRRAHFQKYIDLRLAQTGIKTNQKITPQTVKREMSIISAAWKLAPRLFSELDDFEPFQLPKAKVKRSRRENLVSMADFEKLIKYLTREKISKETDLQYFHRVRLAHILEFALETGFRRKEIAALRFSQYDATNHAVKNVERFKTETRTPFFPLSEKAEKIIINRRELEKGEFIFSPNGKPIEANYRTLKKACEFLQINYGRFTGGFVAHDLRHNFATEIIAVTDIETAKSLTGHKGTEILTYLHTTEKKQREAIQKRENIDYNEELKEIFDEVKDGKLTREKFTLEVKNLLKF